MIGRLCTAAFALAGAFGLMGCVEGPRPVAAAPAPMAAPRYAPPPPASRAQFAPEVEAHIRNVEQRGRIWERMQELRIPGLSIAVINNGVVEWARGYGVMEAGGPRPVLEDTIFQAASVSKSVTAMGALRLVQEGRLALDEDVNMRLVSWHVPPSAEAMGRAVTLRALLSHSAGTTVHGFRGYAANEPIPSTIEILDGRRPANSPAVRVVKAPGAGVTYSGGGFVVVQQLVSDVTGARFDEVMRRAVLEPLGMTHSTYAQPLPRPYWEHAAAGHGTDGDEMPGRWHTYPEMAPAGLWTTPTDLALFVIEVENAFAGRPSRVLAQPYAALMLTPNLGRAALGAMIEGHGRGTRFHHGGSNIGYRCGYAGLPYTGQGAVVMTNADGGGVLAQEVMKAIGAEYQWPEPAG